MEFTRKKKRGQKGKVRRTWLSEDGYRIVWRREYDGVRMPGRYQATVRIIVPNFGGKEGENFPMWDFTDSGHRLFKVLAKARESCERHKRLWTKACEATGVRGLVEIFGKLPTGIPVWARKKLSRKTFELLTRYVTPRYEEEDECPAPSAPDGSMSSPSDPTEVCKSLPPSSTGSDCTLPTSGPASLVPAEDGSTTRKTRRTRSKATETDAPYPCAACGGSGQGTKEACRKAYQEAIARFRQEAKEYEGLVKARRQAIKKLTAEEVQALRELGV